jgi:hypothetical protein
MKIWKIEAYIESEDSVSRKEIIKQINYNLNRGGWSMFGHRRWCV